jgi:microsomal dipeptidase-like Zn-dependent dipeptidase
MHDPVSMTIDQCRRAAEEGAMIEFIGNTLLGHTKTTTYDAYASAMRAIGLDHCILSSDLGQAGNPLHTDGLLEMFAGFRKAGFAETDINRIAKVNPARLIGLPPR